MQEPTQEACEVQGALVLDIPVSTTAEEATRLINEPYQRGFYIHRTLEWAGGARVVYVRKSDAKPRSELPVQSAEAKAIQFIRENSEMSIPQLCAALKALRFVRSPKWVREKLSEIMAARRRFSA